MQRTSRRGFITGIGTIGGAVIGSGCTTDNTGDGSSTTSRETTTGGGTNVVAAGPNGKLVFEPEQVHVSVGDTVTWKFESRGHNVSARPQDSEKISIPDGAKPFASFKNGKTYAVVDEGGTYEHTFETPGEYVYVCIPHISSGMVATVTVSK